MTNHMAKFSPTQNLYIISVNITNKQKESYYHEYVPNLLDVSCFHEWNLSVAALILE